MENMSFERLEERLWRAKMLLQRASVRLEDLLTERVHQEAPEISLALEEKVETPLLEALEELEAVHQLVKAVLQPEDV